MSARPTLVAESRRVADGLARRWELASVHLLLDGRLRCVAAPRAVQVVDGLAPGEDPAGRALRTGEVVVVDDVGADPSSQPSAPDVVAQVWAPVVVDGRAVAVVGVQSRVPLDPDATTEAVTDLLAAAADLAAAVTSLGGLPATPVQRLAALAVDLRADPDRERLRRRVVEGAAELSRCSSAALVRRRPDGGWEVSASTGPFAQAATAWEPGHLAVLAERVAPAGALLLEPGAGDHPGLEFLDEAGVACVAAYPLLTGGEVVGVLLVLGDTPTPPDPSVVAVVELFVSVAAGNLHAARLAAELAERREEALARVGSAEQLRDDLTDACIDAIRSGEVHRTYLLLELARPDADAAVMATLAEAVNGQLRHGDALYRVDDDAGATSCVAVLLATGTPASAGAVAGRLVRSAAAVGVEVHAGWALVDGPPAPVQEAAQASLRVQAPDQDRTGSSH